MARVLHKDLIVRINQVAELVANCEATKVILSGDLPPENWSSRNESYGVAWADPWRGWHGEAQKEGGDRGHREGDREAACQGRAVGRLLQGSGRVRTKLLPVAQCGGGGPGRHGATVA